MEEVRCYVKNDHLGFYIPYSFNGRERRYHPDFIVRVDDGRGAEDLLNLILEVSGEALQEKDAKVSAAKSLWVPAVNNDGRFGRWDFIEIRDPWSAKSAIRKSLSKQSPLGEGTPSNSPIGEGTPS
jgi:type III restriction enzyme